MARNSAPKDIDPEFSQKLKRARQLKGFTQGQLARMVGADIQRISKYERGILVPTTGILLKLAEALDVTIDYLIRSGENNPSGAIGDPELLARFRHVSELPKQDQNVVMTLIDALVKKQRLEELAAS